jgi:hypothetical protein
LDYSYIGNNWWNNSVDGNQKTIKKIKVKNIFLLYNVDDIINQKVLD